MSGQSPPPPPPEPPVDDPDRRFVNNPFARALHPPGKRTVGQWIALVLVSVVGAAIMMAAFLLPIFFAHGLLARSHGRWGMRIAGVLVAAVYVLIVARLFKRKPPAAPR
jgi:hypothetical protein